MNTSDNREILSITGKILERLGDKYLDLTEEAKKKVLQNLNTVLDILNESSAVVSQPASVEQPDEPCRRTEPTPIAVTEDLHTKTTPEASRNGIPETSSNAFSSDLLQHIDDIRSGKIPPKAISDRLAGYISSGDVNRCIGHLVNEDLWNGNLGWKPAVDFYAGISYIWTHAKDIFQPFDKFREISETKAKWNQQYFDTQRNYLRHNFSLERLCHLVMVYDFLHGKKATAAYSPASGKITVVTGKKSPFAADSANVSMTSTRLQSHKKSFFVFLGGSILVILLAIVVLSIRKSKTDEVVEGTPSTQSNTTQKQPATTPAKEERMDIGGRKKQTPAEEGKTSSAPAKENGSAKK